MRSAPFSVSSLPAPLRRLARGQALLLLLAAGALAAAPHARAQTTGEIATIRSFNGPNGEFPTEGLTLGRDGNFYGVTSQGGLNSRGTLFRVSPAGGLTVIRNFDATTDGYQPHQLVAASDGAFYGTATYGPLPAAGSNAAAGSGTVFRLGADGFFSVLHVFADDGARGKTPVSSLIQGQDGALYGTTQFGDIQGDGAGDGTVYRVALDGSFSILHFFDFNTTAVGGYGPTTALVQSRDGSFYGVTAAGGDNGVGVVYKIAPNGGFVDLYSFKGPDGSTPLGPLVEGSDGALYGLTTAGGKNNRGTYFRITSEGVLTTLRDFTTTDANLSAQQSGLYKGTDGNFYLTATSGGNGFGSFLQFTSAGSISTVYKVGFNDDGYSPVGPLAQARDGSFFGTNQYGGASGYGTIFHLVTYPYPPFFLGQTDVGNGVDYLEFPNGNYFGYYSFLRDPHYIYHFDLGYEYVIDAADGANGVYLYDFKSQDFFYTSPTFGFPYFYDFDLQAVLYYYPDKTRPGRFSGPTTRYFYNFRTQRIISK